MSRLLAVMSLTSATKVIPWFDVDSIKIGSGYYNSDQTTIKVGDFVKCDQKIRICYPNIPKHVIAVNINGFPTGSAILVDYSKDPINESDIHHKDFLKDHIRLGDFDATSDTATFKRYDRVIPRLGLEEFKSKRQQTLELAKHDELANVIYSPQYPTDKIAVDFLKGNMVKNSLISYDSNGLEIVLEFAHLIKSAKSEDDVFDCLIYLFGEKLVAEFRKISDEVVDDNTIIKRTFMVKTTENGFSIDPIGPVIQGMKFITVEKRDDITNVKFYSPHPKFAAIKPLYTMFVYDANKLKEIIANNV